MWHTCPFEDPCTEHSEPKTPWPTARKSWDRKIGFICTVMLCGFSWEKSKASKAQLAYILGLRHRSSLMLQIVYPLMKSRCHHWKSQNLVENPLLQYHNKLPCDFKLSERSHFCPFNLLFVFFEFHANPNPTQTRSWTVGARCKVLSKKANSWDPEDFGVVTSKMSCYDVFQNIMNL